MVKKFALLLFVLTTVVISGAGAGTVFNAQASRDWQAWLYSSNSGEITLISEAGQEAGTLYLPLSQAFNAYGKDILISPNGRYIAYTALDNTRDTPNLQLFVYDRQVDALRFAYDLSDMTAVGFELHRLPAAFDEQRQRFAFGYLRHDAWEIVVADLINESVIATLNSDTANITQYSSPIVPVIQRVENDIIAFTMVFYGTGQLPQYPAYLWNTTSGALNETSLYATTSGSLLPATGEVVIPVENSAFPAADRASSNVLALNVLEVFAPAVGNRIPFYNNAEKFLRRAYFIQDGAQVLVEAHNPATGEDSLKVINRDGNVAGEFVGALDHIIGTPDGFVGTFATGGGIALAHVDTTTSDFDIVTLWNSTDASIELVHVQGFGTVSSNLGEWHQLTP